MEVSIINEKKNNLIARTELMFSVRHPNKSTPALIDVKKALASKIGKKHDNIVINHIASEFGKSESLGYAKIYDKQEDINRYESSAKIKRNHSKESEEKTERIVEQESEGEKNGDK